MITVGRHGSQLRIIQILRKPGIVAAIATSLFFKLPILLPQFGLDRGLARLLF